MCYPGSGIFWITGTEVGSLRLAGVRAGDLVGEVAMSFLVGFKTSDKKCNIRVFETEVAERRLGRQDCFKNADHIQHFVKTLHAYECATINRNPFQS